MGRIRKAFGLKGELLVQPITNEPGAVFAHGSLLFRREAGRRGGEEAPSREADGVRVLGSRPFKDAWLVRLEGVNDKTTADLWRGVELLADESSLTPPAENEVYLEELVGMRVHDVAHGDIGVVESWYELPQGLVLEVRGEKWRADIPFNEAFVSRLDRASRLIEVHLPEGLAEPRA